MAYANLDVFVFCFSLADRLTLNEIYDKWIPEVDEINRNAPKMLVGCKSDMQRAVDEDEIKEFLKKHGFFTYEQCSALTPEGVDQVF